MIHQVVICERCGSPWDLTKAGFKGVPDYRKNIYDRRRYIIKTIGCNRAAGNYFEDREIDLCDGCYNKIEKFIMGGEDYENILEEDPKE